MSKKIASSFLAQDKHYDEDDELTDSLQSLSTDQHDIEFQDHRQQDFITDPLYRRCLNVNLKSNQVPIQFGSKFDTESPEVRRLHAKTGATEESPSTTSLPKAKLPPVNIIKKSPPKIPIQHHPIPEYEADQDSVALEFLSLGRPQTILQTLAQVAEELDYVYTVEDQWKIDIRTCVSGEEIHFQTQIFEKKDATFMIVFELSSGSEVGLISVFEEMSKSYNKLLNPRANKSEDLSSTNTLGKRTRNESVDPGDFPVPVDMDNQGLYPGSMDLPQQELELLLKEINQPHQPEFTRCESAKSLARHSRISSNRSLLAENQQLCLPVLLAMLSDELLQLQRYGVFILLQLAEDASLKHKFTSDKQLLEKLEHLISIGEDGQEEDDTFALTTKMAVKLKQELLLVA